MIKRAAVKATTRNAPTRAPDGHGHPSSTPDSCKAVTMPAYLIVHHERRGDDTLLEDAVLTVEFTEHWAVFQDAAGACYAVPREQVRSVMRVDEPEDGPAPQKEG
jgi:hypothetical protein